MPPRTSTRYGARYLASAWWADLRAAYELHPRAPHCCVVCAAPRYQLHHRTYANLGHEHISDLMALCAEHHHALHRAYQGHLRQHPDDSLQAFTDAWVLIHRRRYRTALLPSLALYGYRPPADRIRPHPGHPRVPSRPDRAVEALN